MTILGVLGVLIGAFGLGLAAIQYREAAHVKDLVRNWSDRISQRSLKRSQEVRGVHTDYRSRDHTAWAQSKGEVLGVLDRFVGEFEDIRDDVIAILSTITGDRAERGKGTSA